MNEFLRLFSLNKYSIIQLSWGDRGCPLMVALSSSQRSSLFSQLMRLLCFIFYQYAFSLLMRLNIDSNKGKTIAQFLSLMAISWHATMRFLALYFQLYLSNSCYSQFILSLWFDCLQNALSMYRVSLSIRLFVYCFCSNCCYLDILCIPF